MLRIANNILALAIFHHLATLHNHDFIGNVGGYADIMGYDDDGNMVFVTDIVHRKPRVLTIFTQKVALKVLRLKINDVL